MNCLYLLSVFVIFFIGQITSLTPENGDFYFVFVKNTKNLKKGDREYQYYVNSIIENIYGIIINNKYTYTNPKEIDNLQEAYERTKHDYLEDYGKYGGIIYPTYSLDNKIVIYAYLNKNIIKYVESLVSVSSVNRDHASNNEQDPVNVEDPPVINCVVKRLGYPCCSRDQSEVYYQDEYGDWGFDFNNYEWCGLTLVEEEIDNGCWAETYGFPCCSECIKKTYHDKYGTWGIENDIWCGIKNSCLKKDLK